ncbi:MAG: hypothetical protein JWQ35_1982, partial [Bacteriovoracaceae bacterium]|nr:hypothetical protein [Bacteriovoracaceae bacterium]
MLRPVLFILILIPTFLRAIDLPDSHETALESEKKGFRFLSSQAHDETFSATSKEAMMRHSAHEMFNAFFLNLLV